METKRRPTRILSQVSEAWSADVTRKRRNRRLVRGIARTPDLVRTPFTRRMDMSWAAKLIGHEAMMGFPEMSRFGTISPMCLVVLLAAGS